MFTVAQIKAAHSKVKSGADFPAYIRDIKKLGVSYYETFVTDGHTDYYGAGDYQTTSAAKYAALLIAPTADRTSLAADLKAHQQGKTDYPTFCHDWARYGIEKWAVCMDKMTCTYYDRAGNEVLVEAIPAATEWNDDALLIPSNEGEQFESHGNLLKVIVPTSITDDRFGLYDIEMQPKARGPKLHYHRLMDETFIVREGILTVLTAKGATTATAGTVIHIPRLSAHGYHNDSDGIVKMTMIFNPGMEREDFFRKMYQLIDESPDDTARFLQLYADHDSYPLNEADMIPMSGKTA